MLPTGPRERIISGIALTVVVGGIFFVGSRYMRPKPTIEIQGLSSPLPASSAAAVPSAAPSTLKVDVEGAVLKPGMESLPTDGRVSDAIEAAGGKAADADTEPLNLAAKLMDGTQVFVPHKGVSADAGKVADSYKGGPDAPSTYSSHPDSGGSRSGGKKHPGSPVSLNTSSEGQLESLPGVGPSTAKKILEYRHDHGGFSSIDEILAVKGIGPKKLKAMRQWLRL